MTYGKVLIVDDDQGVREFVSTVARSAGLEPLTAGDAVMALAIARNEKIDAFLLDVMMPGVDGLTLCREIRKERKVTPILLMTGADVTAAEAFAAGCDDLVSKPIEPAILLARVKAHIERGEHAEQLKRAHRMLEHYVSKRTRELVQRAAEGGAAPSTSQREVAVMFTDVRGFTELSESMEPDTLFSLLSSQLGAQVRLVHQFGGYVDKFGGDGLMAVFDSDDMAERACRCALAIMENARQGSDRDKGLRQLGIGINKGPAIIGNIGSEEHLDYSVIGTTVNLAARLCGYASPMSAVVSHAVREAAGLNGGLQFNDERRVAIRGIHEPVAVYTLAKEKHECETTSGNGSCVSCGIPAAHNASQLRARAARACARHGGDLPILSVLPARDRADQPSSKAFSMI
jgi:adenylate cyclase